MSKDLEHRNSPPDFGDDDDDDNKDDDQMFKSARLPATDDVPLSEDEDEENPFGETVEKKKPSATNVLSSSNEASLQISPVTPIAVLEPQPSTLTEQEHQTFPSDPAISAANSLESPISTVSAVTTKSQVKHVEDPNIEIIVSDPTKVGEGMSSYMTYRITTKTSLAMFKKTDFSVNRRFSDFLGLHNKLIHKHLQMGVILPSPPEKDSLSMAKVKISKEEAIPSDFIDRRRSQLERYLNRLARHKTLVQDPDFREFIEMPGDLPKANNTQALSGAGVLRALSNISNQVTKLTTKTSEQDQWFEEKHSFIVDLHTHLKNLFNQLNLLFSQRKEAGQALKALSTSLNHLATIEEHTLLSSALIELANVEEKLEQTINDHSLKEYTVISELIK
ncbi:unnamed protein product, partial [Adineta ricciae]